MKTTLKNVNYLLSNNFDKSYSSYAAKRVEDNVNSDYLHQLQRECTNEREYHKRGVHVHFSVNDLRG
jgi:hypothetical protein